MDIESLLVNYIIKTANVDYADKASVNRYNRAQGKIVEIVNEYFSDEKILELKPLLEHKNPIVCNHIAILLLMRMSMPNEEIVKCVEIQELAIEQMTGDIQKDSQLQLDFWKKGMLHHFKNQPYCKFKEI